MIYLTTPLVAQPIGPQHRNLELTDRKYRGDEYDAMRGFIIYTPLANIVMMIKIEDDEKGWTCSMRMGAERYTRYFSRKI